jgi:hypothetical protein
VRCKDLYAAQIEEELAPGFVGQDFFSNEFTSTTNEWICPNVTTIDLYNDPDSYQRGLNFAMVVNSCEVAKQIDKENGIVSYADSEGDVPCVSQKESESEASGQKVWQKLMTTNFDPE